jgi:hypothetical protein
MKLTNQKMQDNKYNVTLMQHNIIYISVHLPEKSIISRMSLSDSINLLKPTGYVMHQQV